MSFCIRKLLVVSYIIFIQLIFSNSIFAGWSDPVRISAPGDVRYPQILAKGDTLYTVFEHWIRGRGVGYLMSIDAGAIWSQEQELSDIVNTEVPEDLRILSHEEKLIVIWRAYFPHTPYNYNISYNISNDNGLTWSGPLNIFESNRSQIAFLSASVFDSLIVIVFNFPQNDSLSFYYLRSIDFGQSWSQPHFIFNAIQGEMAEQANSGSIIHYVWPGRMNSANRIEIYYMRSIDGGISWSPNIPLSDTDQFHSQLPAIEANTSSVVCTWMDYKYSPYQYTGDILLNKSNDSGQSWQSEQQLTLNHTAERSDIALSGDTIYLSWEDERLGIGHRSIYFMESTNSGTDWSEPYWVDSDTNNSVYPAIAASNSRVYLLWYDRQLPDSSGLYFSRLDPEPDAVENDTPIPNILSLSAYPNPFNSATTITLSGIDNAEIEIYDITGRKIVSFPATLGRAVWDASGVSSGVYFARVAGERAGTIKLVLVK